MALLKSIKKENGITLNYHRIQFIQSTINSHTSIAVLSYVDEESRDMEGTESDPYKEAITYELPYVEDMTVEAAYDQLKILPEFDGAKDI
nr:MAG TPA: hypothetical protein [Caudoviricetes sp.]